MGRGTKLGLIGIAVSVAISVTFGIIDIRDKRSGRRKMNKDDIDSIANAVASKFVVDDKQSNDSTVLN